MPESRGNVGFFNPQQTVVPFTVSAHLNIGFQAPAHVGSHFVTKAVNRPCCIVTFRRTRI
jgi:hypothetical protein